MKLLVATNNPGKITELKRLLDIPGLELLTPGEAGLPPDFDVEETGQTFEENAVLKARQYAQAAGLTALADDSGLCVEALNGEPGVYSKRYAGANVTDAGRNTFLLAKLAGVADERLQARFVAVLALAGADGQVLATAQGDCPGYITREPRGTNGFGYDPIFMVEGASGRTMAELSDSEKDEASHRGRAIREIRSHLARWVASQNR